jgi:hypothetical protein
MHYMVSQAVCKHDYDRLHDSHLNFQDRMHHPIAFLAEMMGEPTSSATSARFQRIRGSCHKGSQWSR